MVTKLGKLECGNFGEDTLTASKLEDGGVLIERTNANGSSQRWTVGPNDSLRVSGKTFGDANGSFTESFLMLNDVELSHFEINTQWGGTIIGEVAAFACAVAAACGCGVTVIDPPPERIPSAPEPPPNVVLPLRAGADVLATLATRINEQGLVRVLRLENGAIVLENAFTGEAWTLAAPDELVLTIWRQSPGPPGRTVITMSCGDKRLPRFYVWNDPTKGLHKAQVVELVKKIANLAGCRFRMVERLHSRVTR